MTVNYLGPGLVRTANNSKGVRTYTRTGLYETTDQDDGEYTVGSHSSVPLIGSVHPEDASAYCVSLQVENTSPWKGWTVTATWDSTNEVLENPLFEAAVIEWDGENYEEVLVYDRDNYGVVNSAGDPFENAMRERTRRIVTVVKNVAAVPAWIISSEDAVNSSDFTLDGITIPAGKAKLGAPRIGKWMSRNSIAYREMSMQIKLNKDSWSFQPLDAGYRFKDGLGDLKKITSDDGTDVTNPVCLDGFGLVLANPGTTNAVFGSFNIYPEYDFNLLPLS